MIEFDLAGVAPGEVQIRFSSRAVQITGERQESSESATRRYHIMEIERGKFERIIELPATVDCKKADAIFENGMMTLTLPRIFGSPFAGCNPSGSIKDFDE
jgi:HSP20 family protein